MQDELIRRAQQGDTVAFRALVEAYTPGAWRVARILISDRGQAEDALQEAWVDVWRGLLRYDTARPFRPWLLAIVGNRCRMLGRRHNVPTQPLVADTLPDPDDTFTAAEAHVIGTIPTPLNPDNISGGEASPIPAGAVLWQSHDPQTLYVAVYHTSPAP